MGRRKGRREGRWQRWWCARRGGQAEEVTPIVRPGGVCREGGVHEGHAAIVAEEAGCSRKHILLGGEADTQERSQRRGMEATVDARRSRGATLHRRMVMSDAAMAEAARTPMFVTLEVSQSLSGWLNERAALNIPCAVARRTRKRGVSGMEWKREWTHGARGAPRCTDAW